MSAFHDVILAGASGSQGYQISRSVRLRSSASAYFNRTPSSSGSSTTWTWSGWIKRGVLGVGGGVFYAGVFSTSNDNTGLQFRSDDTLQIFQNNGATTVLNKITTQVFRDPSAWYHIVLTFDTTNATAEDRVRIYVNGVRVTAFSTNTNISQNGTTYANSTSYGNRIFRDYTTTYLDGYLTEVNFIDGQALTPSSFGETDTITGVWKPKRYTGTYGTNGFYLNFSDNSLNTDVTSTATATAPFGGTADNAKISDGVYLTTNTSTGSAFDVVKYDFGASVQMTRFVVGAFSFSGGSSTFQIQVSNDDSTYTTVSSLSVTSTGTNYSGSINAYARYVKLRATAFGTNGQATLDVFQILQDGIGKDYSGNGNNWTPNNISVTSGTTYDSMIDVPTMWADGGNGRGNYAVLASNAPGIGTISAANLQYTSGTTTVYSALSTISVDSGKWYWEVTATAVNGTNFYPFIGAYRGIPNTLTGAVRPGADTGINGFSLRQDGTFRVDGTNTQTISSFTTNDVLGIALDLTNLEVKFYKNGTLVLTQTGLTAGTYTPADSEYNGSSVAYNFGQRPFAYTPPTGFKALNTQNLPDSTIKKGNQYFNAVTWTGDGVDGRTITGVGFNPDLVWAKGRSNTGAHVLADAVRGTNANLYTNLTDAETNPTTGASGGGIGSVTTDGFVLEQGSTNMDLVNTSSRTYVAWQWKESATAGFDIVTFTNPSSGSSSFAHNLGVKPSMIIVKSRSNTSNWTTMHKSLGTNMADNWINLESTAAKQTSTNIWGGEPTSSVFFCGTGIQVAGATMVAYLFAEVAGFSRFGSYTGNGSTDGPFVYCGFRPAFIMAKDASVTNSWVMYDLRRDPYNVSQNYLIPNSSGAEGVSTSLDITANGFKIRTTGPGALNTSGSTVIFAAFAENPTKYSLAR